MDGVDVVRSRIGGVMVRDVSDLRNKPSSVLACVGDSRGRRARAEWVRWRLTPGCCSCRTGALVTYGTPYGCRTGALVTYARVLQVQNGYVGDSRGYDAGAKWVCWRLTRGCCRCRMGALVTRGGAMQVQNGYVGDRWGELLWRSGQDRQRNAHFFQGLLGMQ